MDKLDLLFEVKTVNLKQRVIEGYASTPHEDNGRDIVEQKSAKFSDAQKVGVYVGHNWKLGALPVGFPVEIKEDEHGLFTSTKIHKSHAGDDLLAVASERSAAGLPMGISIGYPVDTLKTRFERKDGHVVRHITSYDLMEYSFTARPMNEHATVTAVKDMSDEDKRAEIQEAIRNCATPPEVAPSYVYVLETYPDYVIVSDGDDYWKIPYTINADGEAELGDQVEVERGPWVPKGESKTVIPASAVETKAGRVLSDKNVGHLQSMHDLAHTMAGNAGHDLHGHGQAEHDHVPGDNLTEKEAVVRLDPSVALQLLDMDLASLGI